MIIAFTNHLAWGDGLLILVFVALFFGAQWLPQAPRKVGEAVRYSMLHGRSPLPLLAILLLAAALCLIVLIPGTVLK